MTDAVVVDALAKAFGKTKALNGVSFSVPAGTVLGLLGPNGAGKTTCVRGTMPGDSPRPIHRAETSWVHGALRMPTIDRPGIMKHVQQPSALELRGLTKRFDRPAVDLLDLTVRVGEFYALLGPNGAGKTTTLRMVAGLLRPDQGSVSVLGIDALCDPVAAKQITAWVSDEPMIYDKLTPFEYLEFVAGLWGIEPALGQTRAGDLIGWLGLAPHAHERCEGFSKGMRQKVALAGALVHEPRLIILDEPLTGLDARAARLVKDVLLEKVRQGCTVIMTTHILEVAERMADRIGVIAGGKLIAEGTLDELRQWNGENHTSLEDTFLALVECGAVAA